MMARVRATIGTVIPEEFADDAALLVGLRSRDERAFDALLGRYRAPLLRLARQYVPTHAIAEEVVQDTFLAVFTGIDRFEGRSSFKTWLYRILLNIARTRGVREQRSVPFASAGATLTSDGEPLEAEWFLDRGEDRKRHWKSAPSRWDGLPEERALAGEIREVLERALEAMPDAQREVVVMRDVLGASGEEACNALGITETNQRVLLHRGRTRLRAAFDSYYAAADAVENQTM
jgi:RNA polymerase sigma-70 factor (ECF subfamily)